MMANGGVSPAPDPYANMICMIGVSARRSPNRSSFRALLHSETVPRAWHGFAACRQTPPPLAIDFL